MSNKNFCSHIHTHKLPTLSTSRTRVVHLLQSMTPQWHIIIAHSLYWSLLLMLHILWVLQNIRWYVSIIIGSNRIVSGFPGGTSGKEPTANAGDVRASGLIPGLGRSPGGEHGNQLQYTCLENPMDRGVWWATVHGVAESWTELSNWVRMHRQNGFTALKILCASPNHLPCS